MKELENVMFFQLHNLRQKKFSKGLRRAFEKQHIVAENIQQKQQRIKQIASEIDQKLKTA